MKDYKGSHVHILVAKCAQDITRELYAAMMQNNMIYDEWKKQHPGLSPKGLENAYVKRYWGAAIDGARATLAHMLTLPMDDVLKTEISEALIRDQTLVRGRVEGAKVVGAIGPNGPAEGVKNG